MIYTPSPVTGRALGCWSGLGRYFDPFPALELGYDLHRRRLFYQSALNRLFNHGFYLL